MIFGPKAETGEKCITRCFMSCDHQRIYSGDQMMSGACSTDREKRNINSIQGLCISVPTRRWKDNIKMCPKEMGLVLAVLMWLITGTSRGLL
jgi:hypothetical protein